MTAEDRPIYKKHNSFVALRNSSGAAASFVVAKLRALRASPKRGAGLSEEHAGILDRALADVLDGDVGAEPAVPKFVLTSNVIDEIISFGDTPVLPRYLVHRYRYEMYPQQWVADDYPPYLQIEPSSVCNYRCVFCFETDDSFTRKSNGFMGHMPLSRFRSIVDQVVGHIEFISLASRGEPLLCPDIVPMLEYTAGKFLNLKLNTNASLLDEAKCHAILAGGVKTVVFSADAAAEPLYGKLRVNGKFDKVVANIERFQKIRSLHYPDSQVITRVSGVKFSEGQDIESMELFWGGLVDQVAFVSYNPWENTYAQPANGLVQPCSDLWRRMFIWWDGKVNPCDVDYKSTLCVGNVADLSVSQAWQSESYQRLRASHVAAKRADYDPCTRCTFT